MVTSTKLSILLADGDALRRDGLAAVVQGTGQFELASQCVDGPSTLEAIRAEQPDVAVIDLNIEKLHGIEIVRQVRTEKIPTKIIVISGTSDEDIIREVVRAGADGYVLKNGPARHLIDAISYVRDGGQYFSPHLRRDGLSRHLLQERTTRTEAQSGPSQSSRERPQDEGAAQGLEERDYEVLSMMAEGIRPILDRLEDIEGRIDGMETGLAPVPRDLLGWPTNQFADTLRGSRQFEPSQLGRTIGELEAKLPALIEGAVADRFLLMADKLQREIEETHIRTLEGFVKNIQVKLVHRVSALERDTVSQAENMHQLRESTQRTEENLSRLISGVDRLAHDLPQRLQMAAGEQRANDRNTQSSASSAASIREEAGKQPSHQPEEPQRTDRDTNVARRRRISKTPASLSPKAFWMSAACILILSLGFWLAAKYIARSSVLIRDRAVASGAVPNKPAPPRSDADTKTKMEAAEEYTGRKEYATAEGIYRQVLSSEPRNVDAMKALASVLYRQDKIEESAGILDKIPTQ